MHRPRTRSRRNVALHRPTEEVLTRTCLTNTGALAAAAWCAARELYPRQPRWAVTVALDSVPGSMLDEAPLDARFTLEIYAEEWGYSVRRGAAMSWIRVTDVAFVHGRDDFSLLRRTPRLDRIDELVRVIEAEHEIRFDRTRPLIRTSIGGEDVIARWIAEL